MRRRVLLIVLIGSLAGCSSDGDTALPESSITAGAGGAHDVQAPDATGPGDSIGPATEDATEDAVTPAGFDRVQAIVTEPDGTTCELCLWRADDGDRRSQGLMFVTDLGAADGMAFVYPAPHRGNFWMKNTLLPLSIAFFGVDGSYVGEFDMEPCTAAPCDLYRTPDDFLIAIETTQGDLVNLGIGPGSVLQLSDLPCP